MKEISVSEVTHVVENLCLMAAFDLDQDVENKLRECRSREESKIGDYIFKQILENVDLARKESIAICQDTGTAIFFVEVGQDVHIVGGSLKDAINQGVKLAYTKGYLRMMMVDDPIFKRLNTGDNTPAIIYTDIVQGDELKISVLAKGGGAENMSALKMLRPSDGLEEIKKFVLTTVKEAGGNACPPLIVGVGIGGTMEKAALLAKRALIRKIGKANEDPEYAQLENIVLEDINKTGVGPQGVGGRFTALAVHIEYSPTHLTSLPVAVNLNCHASRIRSASL